MSAGIEANRLSGPLRCQLGLMTTAVSIVWGLVEEGLMPAPWQHREQITMLGRHGHTALRHGVRCARLN